MVKTSAAPSKRYWGINHHILMGMVASGSSTRPNSCAVCSLFISTRAANITLNIDIKIPIPILCSIVMPEDLPGDGSSYWHKYAVIDGTDDNNGKCNKRLKRSSR
ncbi:hypothetical protein AHAS_Ahas03G0095500 [Arachis hypogaea]